IQYSSNSGSTWSIVPGLGPQNLNGVSFSGSGFVAVGNRGTILTSQDGVQWVINQTGAITNDLLGVSFAADGAMQGVAVAVGANGTILVGGEIPGAPDFISNSTICSGQPATVSISAQDFTTVDWYGQPTGGTVLSEGSGTTSYAIINPAA